MLGGHVVRAAIDRAKLDPAEVEDVVMGCALPEGATGSNIARIIANARRLSGDRVAGLTVSRFCSSGLNSDRDRGTAHSCAGEGDIYVAGGVESISCVQHELNQHMLRDPATMQRKPGTLLADAADGRDRRQALQDRRASRRTTTACAASSARARRRRPVTSRPRSSRSRVRTAQVDKNDGRAADAPGHRRRSTRDCAPTRHTKPSQRSSRRSPAA